MPDGSSTPTKKPTTEPTSPELQHATKLAERDDYLQLAVENSPDLMSSIADDTPDPLRLSTLRLCLTIVLLVCVCVLYGHASGHA